MTSQPEQNLREAFEQNIQNLGERFMQFPWESYEAYKWWVAQTYYLVRHTSRLISLAAGKCGLEDEEFHKKSVWHLREEVGHEEMALADLRALGGAPGEIPELPATTAIYQAQYFFVERHSPYAQLGYSMLLEGLAAKWGSELVERLVSLYGPRAVRFVKTHAEEDEGHVEAGLSFLDRIESRHLPSIQHNLEHGRALYENMLDAVELATEEEGTTPQAA